MCEKRTRSRLIESYLCMYIAQPTLTARWRECRGTKHSINSLECPPASAAIPPLTSRCQTSLVGLQLTQPIYVRAARRLIKVRHSTPYNGRPCFVASLCNYLHNQRPPGRRKPDVFGTRRTFFPTGVGVLRGWVHRTREGHDASRVPPLALPSPAFSLL